MDGQSEQVVYYKRLCKGLLSPQERANLQGILAEFVKTKSFPFLATELPKVLNTPEKRALISAVRALFPESFHAKFDQALQDMGTSMWTSIESRDAVRVRRERQRKEEELKREAALKAGHRATDGPDSFENFLERQRSLARKSNKATFAGSGEDHYGYLDSKEALSSLEFTAADDTEYADIDDMYEVKRRPSDPPPLPPRKPAALLLWPPESYMTGQLSRQEAEAELEKKGKTDGMFLVRRKDAMGVQFCLSVVHQQKIFHVLLARSSLDEPLNIDGITYDNAKRVEDIVEHIRSMGSRFEYEIKQPFSMNN